ncbi:MAG: GDP-mannose 4,6-dehydratase, partial [Nostoc sp.]
YAKDAVYAMWLMLQQEEKPNDYIIASGETHSVREVVECSFNCVGLNWQDYVSVDPAFYRPDEPVQLIGSIDKIKTELGWQPQHSFEQMVELMVDYDLKK